MREQKRKKKKKPTQCKNSSNNEGSATIKYNLRKSKPWRTKKSEWNKWEPVKVISKFDCENKLKNFRFRANLKRNQIILKENKRGIEKENNLEGDLWTEATLYRISLATERKVVRAVSFPRRIWSIWRNFFGCYVNIVVFLMREPEIGRDSELFIFLFNFIILYNIDSENLMGGIRPQG